MWKEFNPNPCKIRVGDCAIRAIAKALDMDWETSYGLLVATGYSMCNLPNADAVWGAVLREHGFVRESIPPSCPDCYTADDFSREFSSGTFVLGFGGHVATVIDGVIYDAWDSSSEIPQFFWRKE